MRIQMLRNCTELISSEGPLIFLQVNLYLDASHHCISIISHVSRKVDCPLYQNILHLEKTPTKLYLASLFQMLTYILNPVLVFHIYIFRHRRHDNSVERSIGDDKV